MTTKLLSIFEVKTLRRLIVNKKLEIGEIINQVPFQIQLIYQYYHQMGQYIIEMVSSVIDLNLLYMLSRLRLGVRIKLF